MPSTEPNRTEPNRQNQRQPGPYFSWLWFLILGALVVWNLILFWPRQEPTEAKIPYSSFLAQVNANNVAKVHIKGASITGSFVKPITLPPPKPNAQASPTPAGAQPDHPAPIHYSRFSTVFPTVVGDPDLMRRLEAHGVQVSATAESPDWLVGMVVDWLPMLILLGFFWWMSARLSRGSGMLNRLTSIKALRDTKNTPKVSFTDVADAEEAKGELQEEVDFLKHPAKYRELGARIPRGVLLVGAPGTGKTLLARAVAGEAGVPFFSLNASEFVEMFVGVGAGRVRNLFAQAKAAAPAIVFIDELDAVGRRRGAGIGTVNDEREQTLNQLLGELDGFDERTGVITLAATNRPDVLDPALLRPGRFDRQVIIPLPDRIGREGILNIHTRRLHLTPDVDLGLIARGTIGLSGAELANLCNEAALLAARVNRHAVTMADFEEAQDKIRLGATHQHLVDPNERRVVAYHESGHTLIAWTTPEADPVHKITIVPHGQALGITEQLPVDERHNLSRTYLMARLAVLLGGRSAEEVAFNEITTGAENDLIEATRLARRMVTRWGMGRLGLAAFKADDQQPFLGYEMAQVRDYSEATAARIDQEVQRLLEEIHERVKQQLTDMRDRLDRLVQELLKEETIGLDGLTRILGPRQQAAKSSATSALLDRRLPAR